MPRGGPEVALVELQNKDRRWIAKPKLSGSYGENWISMASERSSVSSLELSIANMSLRYTFRADDGPLLSPCFQGPAGGPGRAALVAPTRPRLGDDEGMIDPGVCGRVPLALATSDLGDELVAIGKVVEQVCIDAHAVGVADEAAATVARRIRSAVSPLLFVPPLPSPPEPLGPSLSGMQV